MPAPATPAGDRGHDLKLRDRLHRVTVPVLVVGGEQDATVPPDYGRALARAFPLARFRTINHAGHFPHMDQPGPVLEVIGDFTTRETPARA